MSQTILTFELEKEKAARIQEVCRELSIQVKTIQQKDYRQAMGYLAGIQGFGRNRSSGAGQPLSGEMLVFSGMNSGQLDQFLDAYKKSGLLPIACKAVLTPANIGWTPVQLFAELEKEHRVMEKHSHRLTKASLPPAPPDNDPNP